MKVRDLCYCLGYGLLNRLYGLCYGFGCDVDYGSGIELLVYVMVYVIVKFMGYGLGYGSDYSLSYCSGYGLDYCLFKVLIKFMLPYFIDLECIAM